MIGSNRLEPDASGALRAVPTGEQEILSCGLVLRSVGYRGVALPGVAFDERRATIRNVDGRVVDEEDGKPIRGDYCAGWIKRGPSGVIGTNKKDAHETIGLLLADANAGLLASPGQPTAAAIDALLAERCPDLVSYARWEAIDAVERARGAEQGRPRVKLTSWSELLAAR